MRAGGPRSNLNQSDRASIAPILAGPMHKPPPLLTRHRHQRLVLWALTFLAWLSAALGNGMVGKRQRRWIPLPRLVHFVRHLVILRGAELALRPRGFHDRCYGPSKAGRVTNRAGFGGRLRRALKRRDAAAQIVRLIAILRDIDVWARRVARRMERGFTRLYPRRFCGASQPAAGRCATPAFSADTS
jgi:hypothetical protein